MPKLSVFIADALWEQAQALHPDKGASAIVQAGLCELAIRAGQQPAQSKRARGSMRVWTTTKFEGHYPVGVSAVVIAATAKEAAQLLQDKLHEAGLSPSTVNVEDFEEVDTTTPGATILNDGNY